MLEAFGSRDQRLARVGRDFQRRHRHRTAGWTGRLGRGLPGAKRKVPDVVESGGQSRDISVSVDQSLCSRHGIRTAQQLSPNCTIKTGVLAFGIPGDNANTSRNVYALFGEFALPVTDRLNIQAAARFEDYGSRGRFHDRSEARDQVASARLVGTARFGLDDVPRPAAFVSERSQHVPREHSPPTNAYRAVNIIGNPDLNPERATVFNTGVIFEAGGFTGTVDYWNFNFSDPFQTRVVPQVAGLPTPRTAASSTARAERRRRTRGRSRRSARICVRTSNRSERPRRACSSGQHEHHQRQQDQDDGVDVATQYVFDDVLGGQMTVGTEGRTR